MVPGLGFATKFFLLLRPPATFFSSVPAPFHVWRDGELVVVDLQDVVFGIAEEHVRYHASTLPPPPPPRGSTPLETPPFGATPSSP